MWDFPTAVKDRRVVFVKNLFAHVLGRMFLEIEEENSLCGNRAGITHG